MTNKEINVIIIIESEREVIKMADTVREAYRIVLNDILNNGCGMFVGNYDAKNGSAEFMYGIEAVMEHIVYSICNERGDDFSNLFIKNMIASEQKLTQWT